MKKRIGIFGGGQLGAYLCQAAQRLGFESYAVCFSEESMACAYADHTLVADPADPAAITWLIDNTDVVTFEIEDVPPAALDTLEADEATYVAPFAATMRLLQDKLAQKQWLEANGFPTAPFVACESDTTLKELGATLGLPFVQKRRRGGYDGKGVQVIDTANGDELWSEQAYAERYIGDRREVAVVVARGASGALAAYPVVEMVFNDEGNVLLEARSPASIEASLETEALTLAQNIVQKLDGVGVFAVEMFIDSDGALLINEISPRVHNTGHLTMEGFTTCQYEQHLRAVAGLELGTMDRHQPAAVMLNLLYADNVRDLGDLPAGSKSLDDNVTLHWYGKGSGKRFRKMGHITCTADSIEAAVRGAHKGLETLNRTPGKAA